MKVWWALCLVPLLAAPVFAQSSAKDYEQKCYDLSGDPAIEACTHAIESGQLAQTNLANAYYNRGTEYRNKAEYDLAIADYDRAIQLDPKNASAFNNRGLSWRSKGDFDRAMTDYNQAIQLDPNHTNSYYGRGVLRFGRRDWAAAAADFARVHELDSKNAYAVLWQALSGMRQQDPGWVQRLQEEEQGLSQDWPMPLLRFYAGQITADQVLAADNDAAGQQGHPCAAEFYLGEWKLAHGQTSEAIQDLEKAQSNCESSDNAHTGAVEELKNLGIQ